MRGQLSAPFLEGEAARCWCVLGDDGQAAVADEAKVGRPGEGELARVEGREGDAVVGEPVGRSGVSVWSE